MKKPNPITAREFANIYATDPTQGILTLDLEKANRHNPDPAFDQFYTEAHRRLVRIMKDAAIFAAMA